MIVASLCAVTALFDMFLLIVHPSERGIVIDEYDEQLNETERILNIEL